MQLNTYIFFDGTCEEAMTTYAKVLGGKLTRVVRFRDMGPGEHTPPGRRQQSLVAGRCSLR